MVSYIICTNYYNDSVASISSNGTTVTYKNKAGTLLGTFTTQDTNTWPTYTSQLTNNSGYITIPNLAIAGDWRNASIGLSTYYYEGDGQSYGCPYPFIVVIVARHSIHRGAAIGVSWNSETNGLYVCGLHDTWRGWKQF